MDKEVQMWLRRAKSSLTLSKTPKGDDIFYEDLCFDAQQSAEKSLKALIIHQGLKPPKTHSFRILINEIKKSMIMVELGKQIEAARSLKSSTYGYSAVSLSLDADILPQLLTGIRAVKHENKNIKVKKRELSYYTSLVSLLGGAL